MSDLEIAARAVWHRMHGRDKEADALMLMLETDRRPHVGPAEAGDRPGTFIPSLSTIRYRWYSMACGVGGLRPRAVLEELYPYLPLHVQTRAETCVWVAYDSLEEAALDFAAAREVWLKEDEADDVPACSP